MRADTLLERIKAFPLTSAECCWLVPAASLTLNFSRWKEFPSVPLHAPGSDKDQLVTAIKFCLPRRRDLCGLKCFAGFGFRKQMLH